MLDGPVESSVADGKTCSAFPSTKGALVRKVNFAFGLIPVIVVLHLALLILRVIDRVSMLYDTQQRCVLSLLRYDAVLLVALSSIANASKGG